MGEKTGMKRAEERELVCEIERGKRGRWRRMDGYKLRERKGEKCKTYRQIDRERERERERKKNREVVREKE